MLRSSRLSKSRFTAGLQCHRQLWWRVHNPRAPELTPDAALQARFDMGNRVGDRARQEFPGATLIDLDHRQPHKAVSQTKRALRRGATRILEASFFEDDVFVAVDALTKEPDGWVVTEVKATTRVKPQHYPDAAVQVHVVERAGLPVARVELMHLNKEHRHPDVGPLFIREDISDEVAALRADIAPEVRAQFEMLGGPLPNVEPGAQCTDPYRCPFFERCNEAAPAHGIEELNGIREQKLAALREAGIERVDEIPSDFPLTPLWERHRAALLQEQLIVDPGLTEALARIEYPVAMLDFETVAPALPVWDGCSPFGQVPVQFSVHSLLEDGTVTHHGFLAEAVADVASPLRQAHPDPRPQLAAALVPALEGAATILAWNASFEKRCLRMLAEASPEHAQALLSACDKVQDLLPVVKNNLYHPDFRGSFSIKDVVSALLPDMSYEELEVADGETASAGLEQLLCRPEELTDEQSAVLRTQLCAYCNHDTAVMVELFGFLNQSSERHA